MEGSLVLRYSLAAMDPHRDSEMWYGPLLSCVTLMGWCKSWTVDYGLDCGLDRRLDRGLDGAGCAHQLNR